jgi:hypothetical protein
MILRLDEPIELSGDLRLNAAAKTPEAKAVPPPPTIGGILLIGTDGKCSIPNKTVSAFALPARHPSLRR